MMSDTGMQILLWGLGLLSTILGGLNIMQLLTFRSFKRKSAAEADKAEIESLSKIIEQNQAEIGRLNARVLLYDQRALEQENKYNALYEKYDQLRDAFEEYKLTHK